MKKKLSMIFIVLLFLIGLFLVCLNPLQSFLIKKLNDDLMNVSAEDLERNDALDANFDFNEAATLSVFDVMNAQLNREDVYALGTIVVPKVDIQLPIVKGVGKYALSVGAGTMKPNQKMGEGNYALAGHYFENKNDLLFSPLYFTEIGDIVYITNKKEVYAYEITSKDVILATAVDIINDVPTEKLLTLITCANDGVDRLAVRAKLVSTYTFEEMKHELF